MWVVAVQTRRDYYAILGVQRQASADQIKRAYRRLAVQHHPDRNPGDRQAEELFKELSEAYGVLADNDRRRRYDRFGHAVVDGNSGGSADVSSVTDLLEGFLSEVFRGRQRRQVGKDMEQELWLDFEEAALGTEKTIRVCRQMVCDTCGGTGGDDGAAVESCRACGGKGEVRHQRGFFSSMKPCEACRGSGTQRAQRCAPCEGQGTLLRDEELSVRVPPGVLDGSVRTIRGAGESGVDGPGDLHVYVRVKPHPTFRREGADVLCVVPITFPLAVLGGTIEVPSLQGPLEMRIPAGTQPGRVFRLRGKGIPVFGGYGCGDQLIKVAVEIPSSVTSRQRELIEMLEREFSGVADAPTGDFLG